MDNVRVDKWLWGIRIYKTRTLATKQCKNGKVQVNGKNVKASQLIVVGDVLTAEKEGYFLSLKATKLIGKRVGATIAVQCYEDLTTQDEYNKFESWYVGKGRAEIREKGAGRPTKKERRTIEDFKENYPLE